MKKVITLMALVLWAFANVRAQNIRMVNYFDTRDKSAYYLAWNIKTGKSTQYYWSNGAWQAMEINLPENPLPGAVGNIMMEVYFDTKDYAAYYIVWDSKTGKSIQYYWSDGAWQSMEINLPITPIPGAKGDIYIRPYFDSNDNSAYYLVYDSFQGKSIQYYWSEGAWQSMEINLPEVPVK